MSPTVNSYNDEGNLTGKTGVSTGEVWSYGYDHRNQLVLAEHKASSSDPVDLRVAFRYDPIGNRLEKSVDADGDGANDPVAVRYVLDGWNPSRPTPVGNENWDVLAELHADGSLKTRYLRGDVVDQLFARVDTDDPYWYLTDRQGSIRHITDGTGTVVDTLTYDGYGNILSETNPSLRGNYAYTSREYDAEIDLQYNRARYYDPSTGRWTSQDPLGYDAGDSNLYRYVHNRPTGATDPSGLQQAMGPGSEESVVFRLIDGDRFLEHLKREQAIAAGFDKEYRDIIRDAQGLLVKHARNPALARIAVETLLRFRVGCPRPNSGRRVSRIRGVWISGWRRADSRVVGNSGEGDALVPVGAARARGIGGMKRWGR